MPLNVQHHILNVQPTTDPKYVTCANMSGMTSSKTGTLDLPNLPPGALDCHLFEGLNEPLVSIGVLCDNGLKAIFDAEKVEIVDQQGNVLLTGNRDHRKMYMLPIKQSASSNYLTDTQSNGCTSTTDAIAPVSTDNLAANASIYHLNSNARTVAQRVDFLSRTFGNPADSYLHTAATAGHLKSVPNVTAEHIREYAPNNIETAKGHLDQARQGIWSTKRSKRELKQLRKGNKGRALIVHTFNENSQGTTLHADLTGPYPTISHKGNKKVMVGYCEHGNFIKSVAVKGDSSDQLIRGYNTLISFFNGKLASKGVISEVVRLDNQTSGHLETFMKKVAKTKFTYVAPGNHRTLHAERDIRTWKGHFKATRAGVDKNFPANLWDELLPHVDMTLNILRPCTVVPNTSAWDYMCGEWDYKKQPIGPAGTKVLVYENPQKRASFADNGVEGFYLGVAPDHYRCHRAWITSTRDERVSDTLSWHIHDQFGLLSNHSANDDIGCAIDALTTAIDNATAPADKEYLTRGVTLLTNLQHSQQSITSNDSPPPGLTVQSPRVPVTVDQSRSRTLRVPRVPAVSPPPAVPAPRVTTANKPLTVSVPRVTKTSFNLRTNKNHVRTDPQPTVHNAIKVVSTKGSNEDPLNPLRFRVRWENSTPKQDTWEPLANVKDCKAFIDYVQSKPKLWYLFEGCDDLQSNIVFNSPRKIHPPISYARMEAIEKELTAYAATINDAGYLKAITTSEILGDAPTPTSKRIINQFEMYDFLHMPYTNEMNEQKWMALAAGDMDSEGQELKLKKCIVGPDKEHWIKADITEYHKLLRQHEVMRPISLDKIPTKKKPFITYYNQQCKTKIKDNITHYRIRGTFGGNKQSAYNGITASYQASMTTVKMLLNKTVSDAKSKWMTMDVTDMYLHTTLPDDQWEYMVMNINDVPQEIIDSYHLMDFVTPGETKVYFEVVKALYGMKQAGYLANQEVVEHLNNNGYTSSMHTPCLFRHHTDDIEFTLVTDDFGVRYGSKEAADNLLEVMSRKYPMTHDWSGKKYAGFDLLFDYESATRRVELSMKGYIVAVLKRFKHIVEPTHNVYSPEFFQPINYGSKDSQLVKEKDNSPQLSADDINLLQQITGCFLYYARGVDGTMLLTVDHISREQSHGTQETLKKAIRLLEYAATFPDATIVYYPSDMILMSNVDGSYNSELNAGSRAAAFHYLGRLNDPTFVNGPIECLTTIIPTVVASAAETEYASLFIGGKSLLPLRYTLDDMDCIQPPTVIITDNAAAQGIANNTCKQRRSKSMDMRYHWIRDRVKLQDFKIVWRPGAESIADYLTKTQPVAMVLKMRKFFVKDTPPAFPTSSAKRQYFSSC